MDSEFGIHTQMITGRKRQILKGMPTSFESTAAIALTAQQREQIKAPLFQRIGQLKSKTTGQKNYGTVNHILVYTD